MKKSELYGDLGHLGIIKLEQENNFEDDDTIVDIYGVKFKANKEDLTDFDMLLALQVKQLEYLNTIKNSTRTVKNIVVLYLILSIIGAIIIVANFPH